MFLANYSVLTGTALSVENEDFLERSDAWCPEVSLVGANLMQKNEQWKKYHQKQDWLNSGQFLNP